jgi:hypothetical protein
MGEDGGFKDSAMTILELPQPSGDVTMSAKPLPPNAPPTRRAVTTPSTSQRLGRSPDDGDAIVMCLSEGAKAAMRQMRAQQQGVAGKHARMLGMRT